MRFDFRRWAWSIALVSTGMIVAAAGSDVTIGTSKAGVTVTVDRIVQDGRALVTVEDASKQPQIGLGIEDFTVSKGGKQGRVVSVQSVTETKDVPINIVLVLDNSFSMEQRDAVQTLLAGMEKLFGILRPVDEVHMVTFDPKATTKVGDRDLRVQTFKSSSVDELRAFVTKAYGKQNVTSATVLYEGMLAGVDIIGKLPAENPRILIVFSDGDDLNSKVKADDVLKASQGVGKFNAFAIDFRESPKTDEFLTKFATDNHGKIWKAKSNVDLMTTWNTISTTLDYSYILTYEFTPQPVVMVFDEAALFEFDKAELKPEGKEQLNRYAETAKAELSRADKIKISGHTDNVGKADYNVLLSQKRAMAVSNYLISMGVNSTKIQFVGEGMTRPVADNRTDAGRAKNRRVEIEIVGLGK